MLKREEEKYEPVLQRIKHFVLELDDLILLVRQHEITADAAVLVAEQLLRADEVNDLPEEFQELKNRMVLQLRRFALAIWKSHRLRSSVFHILQLARHIDADKATLALLDKDEKRYHELIVQQEIIQEEPKKSYLSVIIIGGGVLLAIILLFYALS